VIRACSHLVIASKDVPKMARAFAALFGVKPHYEHPEFAEFVLPSRFRLAFFRPAGTASRYFTTEGPRSQVAYGITADDVDRIYALATSEDQVRAGFQVSGPPKSHPWGEKSFLLVDPDGNRWEIAQSPSEDGMLVNRNDPLV